MSRKMARETAMQAYYQMEIHKEYVIDITGKHVKEAIVSEKDKEYIDEMIKIFIDNKETIDKIINENLKGWDIDRLSKIDLSILRLGLTEMLYRDDIPVKVSINEAIELGKTYGTDDSSSFISGLLGSVVSKEALDE